MHICIYVCRYVDICICICRDIYRWIWYIDICVRICTNTIGSAYTHTNIYIKTPIVIFLYKVRYKYTNNYINMYRNIVCVHMHAYKTIYGGSKNANIHLLMYQSVYLYMYTIYSGYKYTYIYA